MHPRITSIGLAKSNGAQAQVSQLYFASTRVWNNNVWISTDQSTPTVLNTTDYNMTAHAVRLNYIRVRATAQASGTWYVTFYYNDCSGTPTSSTKFRHTLRLTKKMELFYSKEMQNS